MCIIRWSAKILDYKKWSTHTQSLKTCPVQESFLSFELSSFIWGVKLKSWSSVVTEDPMAHNLATLRSYPHSILPLSLFHFLFCLMLLFPHLNTLNFSMRWAFWRQVPAVHHTGGCYTLVVGEVCDVSHTPHVKCFECLGTCYYKRKGFLLITTGKIGV